MSYVPGAFPGEGSPFDHPPRTTRAGWWFWYPFVFGLAFTIGAVAFAVGAVSDSAASGGLTVTSISFAVIGIGSLLVAWYSWRDIHSSDQPEPATGDPSSKLLAELHATGITGIATIKAFKYLGASKGGAAPLELQLDVAGKGVTGGAPVVARSRMPLSFRDRITVGATVPVLMSSIDPAKLVVEWDGLLPPDPSAAAPPASPGAASM